MIAVIYFTINKLKEPSFMILLMAFILIGFNFSSPSTLSENMSSDVIGDVITAGKGEPLLAGTIFAFLISLLLTVFTGSSEIPREISSRTIMLILAKPIRRETYLVGKFFGIFLMGCTFFTCFELPMVVNSAINSDSGLSVSLIARQFTLLIALLPVAALAVTVSCFTSEISGMILTICYLLFGLSVAMTPILLAALPDGMGVSFIFNAIYYCFPNFVFFIKDMNLMSFSFAALIVYALSITAMFLTIASIRMKTRDLNIE